MKKRVFSMILTAAIAVTGMTGCGLQKEYKGATLELNMDNAWRSEKLTKARAGYNYVHAWDNNILLSRSDNQRTLQERFQFLNTETGESVEFTAKAAEERQKASNFIGCSNVVEYPDGTVGMMIYEVDRRGEGVVRYCVEVYDENMQYLRSVEIPEAVHQNAYIYAWMDNQGNWYCEKDGSLTCYNQDFEKYGDISIPAGLWIEEMACGKSDGTMYASVCKDDPNGGQYYEIYEVSAKDRTMNSTGVFNTKETIEKQISHNSSRIYTVGDFSHGGGGYDFCWNTVDGMYGYKDGEEVQAISWVNSDFPIGGVSEAYFMENGSVVAVSSNFASPEYYLCTPRSQEEMEAVKLISLSTLGLYFALETAVIDYNKAENGNRIVVVDYNQYNTDEDNTLGKQTLYDDMLNGIVADLVCTDGMHFESLAGKGLFGDWYELMDADESFSREEYLQNFFHAYEYDDKLQRLAVQYSVHTAMAKTQFTQQEGMDLEEYRECLRNLPQGMDFYDFSSREWMLDTYFKDNLNAYVDAKNAKCYFDSESFAYILGRFGTLPTDDEIWELGEEWAAQRMPSYPESHLAFQENRAFIEDAVFCQPIDFRRYNRLTFHDEPVTMVGIPMDYDEGNGGLFRADFTVSVNAQSEYRAEIWDFMKHLLQEEYQSSLNDSFPVHLGALEAKYDEAMHMVSAKGYFGVSEVPIGESNAEEMGKLRTYLEGIQTAYYYDETIYNILWEETDKYLAGDQTAAECGRMVQSRVSIYLSEQS